MICKNKNNDGLNGFTDFCMKDNSHPHMELTERLIGAAMTVHRELGLGLDEKIYENAFCIEMGELGIPFTQQKQYPVHYRSRYVGKLATDLVADTIHQTHVAQLLSYLAITKLQVGLIFNFKTASLTFQRHANIYRK